MILTLEGKWRKGERDIKNCIHKYRLWHLGNIILLQAFIEHLSTCQAVLGDEDADTN